MQKVAIWDSYFETKKDTEKQKEGKVESRPLGELNSAHHYLVRSFRES